MGAVTSLRLIAAALALLAAFAAGWVAQGWRADAALQTLRGQHARTLQAIADKTTAAQEAVRRYEQTTAKALAELDQQKTQEIENARLETDRLRRCIAAGTCGVRFKSAPTPGERAGGLGQDAPAGSVGNAAPALDASVQQDVLDLRESIKVDELAIEYLQQYALRCQGL